MIEEDYGMYLEQEFLNHSVSDVDLDYNEVSSGELLTHEQQNVLNMSTLTAKQDNEKQQSSMLDEFDLFQANSEHER